VTRQTDELEESIVCSSFSAILAETARVPLKSANVLLNQNVVRISNTDDSSGVNIEVQSGEKFAFDGVLMTTPLGWLKKNGAAFEPALPESLQQAIGSISVGHLEKVNHRVHMPLP